jgi:hypothetical protein
MSWKRACRLPAWVLVVVLSVVAGAPAAGASAVGRALVVGAADNGSEGDNLRSSLEALGFPTDRAGDVPADLSGYQSVWYVEAYAPLDADERDRLVAYSKAGGNLYLTGVRLCCAPHNGAVEDVLDRTLEDTDVQVGGLGDIDGPFAFNSGVTDHVATVPNFLVDFIPHSPGGMAGIGGVSGRNVLASSADTPVGAVWSEHDLAAGVGRIALLMDIDWLNDSERAPIVENLANFLSAGGLCFGEAPAALAWTAGPDNCTAINTPATVTWTVGAESGAAPDLVASPTGVTADCAQTTSGSTTTLTCTLSGAEPQGATLRVIASVGGSSSTRHYRVRPKNDPRNVPPGFAEDSNWWTWPDGDEDGLPDWWEEKGVWVKGDLLDLPALGARPDHKDLFLHYDFQVGEEQSDTTLNTMKSMFADAPLANPDGSDGIRLHIERGASIPSSVVGDFSLSPQDIIRVGTYSGYLSSPEYGGSGVPPIYKWMLNFDASDASKRRLCSGKTSAGCGAVKGQFAWTATNVSGADAALEINLPVWNATDRENARAFSEASNAAHELGHMLGLRHHGADAEPTSDKSYKSIMSYAYSHFGLPGDGFLPEHHLDYSRLDKPNLDWRIGTQFGALTFVWGQDGSVPDFYANASDDELVPVGEQPKDLDEREAVEAATPASIASYIDAFDVPASPRHPTVTGAAATVVRGAAVDIELHGEDPAGRTVSYVVATPPSLGEVGPTERGLRYQAPAGRTGEDTFTVRAVNGILGSDEATVTVQVVEPPVAPPTPGGGPTTGGAATPTSGGCRPVKPSRTVRVRGPKAARRVSIRVGTRLGRKSAAVTLLHKCRVVATGRLRKGRLRLVVPPRRDRNGKRISVRLRGSYTLVVRPATGRRVVVALKVR